MSSPAVPKAISPTAEPKNHERKQKQTHHRPEVSVGKETESRGGGASLSFTATLPVGFSGRPPRVAGVLSISLACALSNAHHHYGALSLVKRSGALNASCQLLRITCEGIADGAKSEITWCPAAESSACTPTSRCRASCPWTAWFRRKESSPGSCRPTESCSHRSSAPVAQS